MSDPWARVQDLFDRGLQLPPTAREALLRADPGPDSVHAEVRGLWRAADDESREAPFEALHRAMRDLIHRPPPAPRGLDGYTLEDIIGQGGMGVVYKARRHGPIARTVALKVLPLGHCTPDRLRRFRDEQRALALIDHPNVAAVFDCGQTAEGQPYYTMAYLPSVSITAYADSRRLTVADRLALCQQLCRGLAQAHQKGIIHRDINPNNVLVAEEDGRPLVKIIDFGIAKFTDGRPADTRARTRAGTVMGTPGYMSPEQADADGEAVVDTLSDIYALGALLYTLLCGCSPLGEPETAATPETLRGHARGKPVPAPAERVRDDADGRAVAAARGTSVTGLRKLLAREPGWIALKALSFEPHRRYATCEALEADLARYLDGLPVQAGPPNPWYRRRKLLLYYRKPLGVVAAFAAVLVTAMVLVTQSLVHTRRAEARLREGLAELRAVHGFTQDIFQQVDPGGLGADVRGYDLLRHAEAQLAHRYKDQPTLDAGMRLVLGRSYLGLGYAAEARDQLQAALERYTAALGPHAPQSLPARESLAYVYLCLGEPAAALDQYRFCIRAYRAAGPEAADRALGCGGGEAQALADLGDHQAALGRFAQVLNDQEDLLGPLHPSVSATRLNYVVLLMTVGQRDAAQAQLDQALSGIGATRDPDHPLMLRALHNLAELAGSRGDETEAAALLEDVLARRTRVLGPDHPETLLTCNSLAVHLGDRGDTAAALALLTGALEGRMFAQHPVVLRLRHNLGHFLIAAGEPEAAEAVLCCVLADRRAQLGAYRPDTLRTWWTYGEALAARGLEAQAHAVYRDVAAAAERGLGPQHRDTLLYRRLCPVP